MGATLHVRPYTAADHEGVIELWQLTFPDEPAWNESAALIQRKLRVQPELFFVCVDGGRVIGTVLAGFDGVRGWVHKVACHPNRSRAGVASQLMQAAEAGLARMGCQKLNLQVRASNHAAVAFYKAAGYAIEDRVSLGKRLG